GYDTYLAKCATRQKEQERQRAEKEKERKAAEDERARQAAKIGDAARAVMSLIGDEVREKMVKKEEEETERKQKAAKRIESTKTFFEKALSGQLVARVFKTKDGRCFVSDDDPDVLSMRELAELDGQPEAEIRSRVTGSIFKGKVDDTHEVIKDGKKEPRRSDWMVATFEVGLVTKEGRPVVVTKEGKPVEVRTRGFVLMNYREANTFKKVAAEHARELGLPDPGSEDYWPQFMDRYYLKPLPKAAKWASDTLYGKRKSNPSSEESGGVKDKPRPKTSAPDKENKEREGRPERKRGGRERMSDEEKDDEGDEKAAMEDEAGEAVPVTAVSASKESMGSILA
ncbi:MAG: hypothetical protein AB1715_14600, partial [Acidobacteriota bacterium]